MYSPIDRHDFIVYSLERENINLKNQLQEKDEEIKKLQKERDLLLDKIVRQSIKFAQEKEK